MKHYLEQIPSLNILYMRRIGAYGGENYDLMQQMKDWVSEHNLWQKKTVLYGIAWDNAEETLPEKCQYDVCLVTNEEILEAGVDQGVLPGGQYLVFEVEHTVVAVQAFWGAIGTIMEKQDQHIDQSRPILERYQNDLIEQNLCEFCVPVLVKAEVSADQIRVR